MPKLTGLAWPAGLPEVPIYMILFEITEVFVRSGSLAYVVTCRTVTQKTDDGHSGEGGSPQAPASAPSLRPGTARVSALAGALHRCTVPPPITMSPPVADMPSPTCLSPRAGLGRSGGGKDFLCAGPIPRPNPKKEF